MYSLLSLYGCFVQSIFLDCKHILGEGSVSPKVRFTLEMLATFSKYNGFIHIWNFRGLKVGVNAQFYGPLVNSFFVSSYLISFFSRFVLNVILFRTTFP